MYILATEYLQFGANLFFWIVAILIGLVAAVSFLDFRSVHGPQAPHHEPEDHAAYWESRKHAESVHQEFPKEKAVASKDPITGRP
ncbi:hypothetical protein [Cesiribacter sp. SM1]|uniref:hypothetical protein n=1 Tax=Cesiribacter sp. SM1 TaxID=2861196 RepID=UPI001CD21329|nr:hypothetical protein [Cesiribacter sp. SM1]